uniref:Uncharacterized protein n=1 Tax=Oryza rufipogon TaxID=4529 RepID=A0A0E0PQR3_ORYRU
MAGSSSSSPKLLLLLLLPVVLLAPLLEARRLHVLPPLMLPSDGVVVGGAVEVEGGRSGNAPPSPRPHGRVTPLADCGGGGVLRRPPGRGPPPPGPGGHVGPLSGGVSSSAGRSSTRPLMISDDDGGVSGRQWPAPPPPPDPNTPVQPLSGGDGRPRQLAPPPPMGNPPPNTHRRRTDRPPRRLPADDDMAGLLLRVIRDAVEYMVGELGA